MIRHSPDIKQLSLENVRQSSRVPQYADSDVSIIETLPALVAHRPLHLNMCAVMLCTRGCADFRLNGKDASLRRNQVLFCQPHVLIEDYRLTPDFECKILCLSDEIIRRLLVDKLNLWTMAVYVKRTNILDLDTNDIDLFGYYHALITIKTYDESRAATAASSLHAILRALLLDLSAMLSKTFAESVPDRQDNLSHDRMVFLNFMTTLSTIEVKKHSVEHYASLLCVSPKYLSQVCKKHSDKTAGQWIADYIKEDIRYYLSNQSLCIKEAAVLLGFDNLSFFGKYVKKCFGQSPKALRAQLLAGQQKTRD